MLAGLVPPEGVMENLFHASLLAASGLVEIFGVHWLVATKLQSSHGDFQSPCVSGSISKVLSLKKIIIRKRSYWIIMQPNDFVLLDHL